MEMTQDIELRNIIEIGFSKAISYQDYRELINELVKTNSTTGNDKSDIMVNYTMLNDRRMKRWDKTVKVSDTMKNRLSKFTGNVTWIVITESWCGDAAHVVPVINRVAELHKGIDLKLVMRDENEALMDQFLTNGGKSIPKLIMIDNASQDVISTFGPRPSQATKLVNDYKAENGTLTPEFKENLQHWYNSDKGQNTIEDLLELLGV